MRPTREENCLESRHVHICSFPEEESQMSRMIRIAPTTVLTVAALALAAPAAQAKPMGPGLGGGSSHVSPIVQSIQAAKAANQSKSVVVTTADKPLANPVQISPTLGAGLMHASTVHVPIDKIPTTPVNVPDSSGNGFDWTAAAIGAGLGGILMLTLAAGFGLRRRGQLAA
jgi:hypothetical protein